MRLTATACLLGLISFSYSSYASEPIDGLTFDQSMGVTTMRCPQANGSTDKQRCDYLKSRCTNYRKITLQCAHPHRNLTIRCDKNGNPVVPLRSGCQNPQ